MPLPFILAAASSLGIKKGVDGFRDSSNAEDIIKKSEHYYTEEKAIFDKQYKATNQSLESLDQLQLKISSDFAEFKRISESLLEKLSKHQNIKDLQINIPKNDFDKFDGVTFSVTALAGSITILGSPLMLLVASFTFSSHAKQKLRDAKEYQIKVQNAVHSLRLGTYYLQQTETYSNKIYNELNRIYQIFDRYFQSLKNMDTLVHNGIDIDTVPSAIIQIVDNGYKVAAILTDIITTPLFKPKKDNNGKLVKYKEGTVEFETDENGMKIINKEDIDIQITSAKYKSKEFQ